MTQSHLLDMRPTTLRQSVGLVDRLCTDDEMLRYLLETESSRRSLERYVFELNRQVGESVEATRQAEMTAQGKSDFLAMMSHEMRTPLNGIIGMTSLLESKSLEERERECIEVIRRSGETLLAIIDDVLDFSKIEAGRLTLECADFNPARATLDAIQIVERSAAAKSLTLSAHLDPALPALVSGDVMRLRQVLLNLLSNAIKFTAEGEIVVRVELRSASSADCSTGYELYFSVRDNGIGISPEQQSRLFQPFSQAEASTARMFGGTGLGLAISKRLVDLMGGAIGVESRPNEGSRFWFTIAVRASVAAPPRPVAKAPAAPPATAGFRLLLVEDNPINQKVACLMLHKLGYQVDVARNGLEALDAVASAHYDLILMDCVMPEMDGFEATRRLRASAGHAAEVPIIAMTANAFADDRKACLAAGMNDFLSKPVRQSELAAKLEGLLQSAACPLSR
jgi:signal transduction histidine kinase/ActR/RegA family two-component response regulator